MQIDLNKQIASHFQRLTELADEAADDSDQGFQSRSAAMNALTAMLKDLTKAQESLISMERLMKIEAVIIDLCKECLTDEGQQAFLTKLEQRLQSIQ